MTPFYQLILRNNFLAMSNLSEFIKQLKSNQEAFNAKLSKVEDLGSSVSKSVLRDLIQDARELHEGTVVLSYILFNEEEDTKAEQLEIPLSEPEPEVELIEEAIENEDLSEEAGLINALEDAIELTHKEIHTESLVSEIANEIAEVENTFSETVELVQESEESTEIPTPELVEEYLPTQEEITISLEEDISSVISMHSSSSNIVAEPEEDNSLAAKLAKQRIESLNSAIGINEKFLFTNELFDGNTEQFLQTIDDLNNCSTLDEANTKLSVVAQKRKWELEEEPYQKLQSLLKRKYQ